MMHKPTDNYNLQKTDNFAYETALDLLRDSNNVRINATPYKQEDGSVYSEFKHTVLDKKNITFQISGFIKQTKRDQKCVFFMTIFNKKRNGEEIKMTQKQHKQLTKLINSKLIY